MPLLRDQQRNPATLASGLSGGRKGGARWGEPTPLLFILWGIDDRRWHLRLYYEPFVSTAGAPPAFSGIGPGI